ncbi:RNA methyltransferase [Ancylothrix sp. C2]|uniref:RNA methyltransferase n=1 Tax=Ancylothrix sp. D3o TaxID=2953691 RepID=UPI0021BAE88C|nr:RNA methyltransferase [Ancylothrix sp. D3o]MCT7951563.1 RNA methyltransferase [Ancylothrix sp. D3o]
MTKMLSNLRIVLVEPAGPLNVGSVARVMKNMGLKKLVIVNPQCDVLSEEARKMAVHAADILEAATQVDNIPAALAGCERAAATTSRERGTATALSYPQECLPWLLEAPSALIFGPEDRGLSNDELKYAQRFIRIPSSEIYPSLNLAQAVGICCYELYQLARETTEKTAASEPSQAAPIEEMEGYYQHLEKVLLKIGYFYPHTAASRMEKFRILLNRAMPREAEIAMLRGILRQMEWALKVTGVEDGTARGSVPHQEP